jgi:RNA polymerase sigma-70 factor (ECF subfamily)
VAAAPDPDAVLMLRVKRGDLDAFETLVERYRHPVMSLLYRTLPDATEAEDLAQAVFVQVFKSAHRYRPAAKFSTWLFTIARNLCLNEIRRRHRHPAFSLDEPGPEEGGEPRPGPGDTHTSGPAESLLAGELREKVETAIRALPENQRLAIVFCQQDDLSYEDIAEILGCSVSATKSLIHRGRETLKARLKPYLRSGTWEEDPGGNATFPRAR